MNYNTLKYNVLNLNSDNEFLDLALEVFKYQYSKCRVYREFCNHLSVNIEEVTKVEKIPFLPIEFFKSHKILSTQNTVNIIFSSSGTTGMQTSKHHVSDIDLYEQNFIQIFEDFYGSVKDYTILALLPSYLEREGSSLIYMVDHLIQNTNNHHSGFYLHNTEDLYHKLIELESKQQQTLLIGVSFALLDFVEHYNLNVNHTIVMETGGMKGRRKEMIREELHGILRQGFGVDHIHSEYGMTELLSQAYSKGNGIFEIPKTMKIFIRDVEDPLSYIADGKTGGINVIDLANINSCSFIATKDLGKYVKRNQLKILGRFDNSDIRGCNLLTL
jgi:phenylacetate-coenzyme A ligase PaaK-like adenylate-forming protein